MTTVYHRPKTGEKWRALARVTDDAGRKKVLEEIVESADRERTEIYVPVQTIHGEALVNVAGNPRCVARRIDDGRDLLLVGDFLVLELAEDRADVRRRIQEAKEMIGKEAWT